MSPIPTDALHPSSSFSSIHDSLDNVDNVEPEQLPLPAKTQKQNVGQVLATLLDMQLDRAPRVLVRVDYNVPMKEKKSGSMEITDDSRIKASLSTIKSILGQGCNVVLISHLGRPKPDDTEAQRSKLTLKPIAERLQELMPENIVEFVDKCIGKKVDESINCFPHKGRKIILLENLRFHPEEENNNEEFSRSLASKADAYVNDAFGTCHREHASTAGIPNVMPRSLKGIGTLVESEVSYLDFTTSPHENEKVAAVVGGSKVSTKLPIISALLAKVDTLVLGGALAFTFLKAKGVATGSSLVEDNMLATARDLMQLAEQQGKDIVLPIDAICAQSFPSEGITQEIRTCVLDCEHGIEDGWSGFDIGEATLDLFKARLEGTSKTIFNGPMGVFEINPFNKGTNGLINILAALHHEGATVVVGGGDSVAALEAINMTSEMTYVSTGGGASLELLSGCILPGIAAIPDVEI